MMYPVYAGVSKPQMRENMPLSQVAVILGQLLAEDTLDRFLEEVKKSTLTQSVKNVIGKEFYQGCSIPHAVKYMHNHHIKEVSQTGFAFDWVLRHKAYRNERMSTGR
jgi:hypothetical protein